MHSSSQDSLVTSHRRRWSLTLSRSLDSEERSLTHPLSLSRLTHSLTLTLSSPSLTHSQSLVSLTLTLSSPSLAHSHSLVSEERGPSLSLTLTSHTVRIHTSHTSLFVEYSIFKSPQSHSLVLILGRDLLVVQNCTTVPSCNHHCIVM